MLAAPRTSENCVGVVIDGEIVFRVKNKTTISCTLEITPAALEGNFVITLWFKRVLCTLVDCKCTVRGMCSRRYNSYQPMLHN